MNGGKDGEGTGKEGKWHLPILAMTADVRFENKWAVYMYNQFLKDKLLNK